MGYTHYWKSKSKKCDEKLYKAALADMKKIISANKDILEPEKTEGISFNGIGDGSHEDFCLPATYKELKEFDCCKTARKEYDKVVVACLTVLHNHLGDAVEISSDGDREELEEGLVLAKAVLNKNFVHIFDKIPNSIKLLKKLKTKKEGVEKKLELLRVIYCLGGNDIDKVFPDNDHLMKKYIACRREGGYGNYKFLMEIDSDNAKLLFEHIESKIK